MFTLLYWKRYKERNEKLPIEIKRFLKIYFILLFIVLFVDTFSGGTSFITQVYNLIKSLYLKFGLAFLFYFAITQTKDVDRFNSWLSKTIVCVCIYGIIEYFTHKSFYLDIMASAFPDMLDLAEGFYGNQRGVLSGRIGATLVHPLNLGQMLLVCLGYFVIIRKQLKLKKFYYLSILMFVTIVFTGSRSCILPAVLLFLSCVFMDLKSKPYLFVLLFIGSVFVLSMGGSIKLDKDVQETINSLLFFWDSSKGSESLGGSSISLRETQWETVLYILKDASIWFGHGFGYMATEDYKSFHEIMAGAESIFFTYTMEQGLIGLMGFIFLLVFMGFVMRKYRKKTYGRGDIFIFIYILSYLLSLVFTGDRSTSFVFFVLTFVYVKSLVIYGRLPIYKKM